ncbi:MAG: RNA polymerase sigma factor [Pseudohongiella sp.]|uniref:RNA polymerase sigma factor n=1 Tax=Pseudohongiella sp. TaxID=1979412 RepID=UPI0034A005A5
MSAEEITNAVQLAQGGDRKAFHLLYQQHVGRVYAICWRLMGDRQKAEDVSQEVFVKVWQCLPDFKGDSSFATWLHSIATRTAIDCWRRDKRLSFVDPDQIDGMFDQDQSAAVTDNGDAGDLEQAIQRLPAQAKAVFVLFALEGYQHKEIAELLSIAEGSSKAQYHRARQLLRGFLREE